MPASITVTTPNRDSTYFIVEDTSDYMGATVTNTDLTITAPDGNVYNIDIVPENFGTVNSIYNITTTLAGYPSSNFQDGVYSFVLTATLLDTSVLVSPVVYFLLNANTLICWANQFEDAIDHGDEALTDDEKKIRTEVRELIQAADENFEQFRYLSASNILQRAFDLCTTKCKC